MLECFSGARVLRHQIHQCGELACAHQRDHISLDLSRSAVAAGFWRQNSSGTMSFTELSGDATTSNGGTVTVVKVNGVAYPTTGASFDGIGILTASNSLSYFQINAGADCGDSTHALKYTQSTHLFGCQAITAAAPGAGGSNTQVQFNSANALAGSANLTWVSPVLTIGAAGVTGQLSLAGSTSGTTGIAGDGSGFRNNYGSCSYRDAGAGFGFGHDHDSRTPRHSHRTRVHGFCNCGGGSSGGSVEFDQRERDHDPIVCHADANDRQWYVGTRDRGYLFSHVRYGSYNLGHRYSHHR
jgi:hypothetical protein